jgi:hypothetical protein
MIWRKTDHLKVKDAPSGDCIGGAVAFRAHFGGEPDAPSSQPNACATHLAAKGAFPSKIMNY